MKSERMKIKNKKNKTRLLVVFCSVDVDLLLFITPVWKNIFWKEKWPSSPKTGFILSTLQSDAMIAQHLHNNSIFVSIANEKHICVSLQGQGTRPCWRVVKIDTKHKLSAPLKDLEAPMCRWVLAFELSPRFTKKIPSAVSTSWVKRWFMWFLSFFHCPLAVILVT